MARNSTLKDLYLNNYTSIYGTLTASATNAKTKTTSELVNEFSKTYEAKVVKSHRKYARTPYRPVSYFVDPARADVMSYQDTVHYQTIPIIEIDIPEDSFERMLELDSKFRSVRGFDPRWFEQMIDRERLEAAIRQSNPAVKKAYENYSMLLNLVKDDYRGFV